MANKGNTNIEPTTLNVVIAFAIVYVVWGSTYFFIQSALKGFPPMLLGATRFILAALIMMAWSIARGEFVFNKQAAKVAAVSGIMLLFVGNGVVIWVEQFLPSAMVAIIISSTPIWFVLFDKPKWRENFTSGSTIAGLIIGFVGVLLLFSEKIFDLAETVGHLREIIGMMMVVGGAMSWAAGSLYSKYNANNVPASINTTFQMLAAGLMFLPLAIFSGELNNFRLSQVSVGAWLSLVYLVFAGSITGFSAYVWLLKVKPATQVSTYAYVNPIVAVLLGVLFASEKISLVQLSGLAVILVSVFLINLVKYRINKKKLKNTTGKNDPHKAFEGNDTKPVILR